MHNLAGVQNSAQHRPTNISLGIGKGLRDSGKSPDLECYLKSSVTACMASIKVIKHAYYFTSLTLGCFAKPNYNVFIKLSMIHRMVIKILQL